MKAMIWIGCIVGMIIIASSMITAGINLSNGVITLFWIAAIALAIYLCKKVDEKK